MERDGQACTRSRFFGTALDSARDEDPSVTHQEIRQRTHADAQEIGDHHSEMQLSHEQSHQRHIANQGNRAVAQIESQESSKRLQNLRLPAIAPGESLVP